jgi:hypothetical protein
LHAVIITLALGATFFAGAAWQRFGVRDAQAQAVGTTSNVYVPSDGLVFRALDGKPIARISRGPHGGVFELYDDRSETPTSIGLPTTPSSAATSNPFAFPQADALDDPFAPRAPSTLPAPGF